MIIRESIMEAIVTNLAGITLNAVPVNINRSRKTNYNSTEFPMINVYQRSEDVDYGIYEKADRNLNVTLEIQIIDNDAYETDLNDIYGQAVKKLRADITQGVTGVYDTMETQIGEPSIVQDGDPTVQRMLSSWIIEYRTSNDDPEVI